MKKKTILLLTCILMLTMLSVLPVYAKKGSVVYKAKGKLVTYELPHPASEVVNGRWSVKVKNGEVDFKAFYRERNLDEVVEQSPVGSIDCFWIHLVEGEATINDETGECTIEGTFYVKKKWWILPDNPDYPYPPPVVWLDPQYEGPGTVTIDPTECIIWFYEGLQGPTLAIKY